jgi:hypothetical protein
MALPNRNVVVAFTSEFSRSTPDAGHATVLAAQVIGKYVKQGTTGHVDANVQLPDGTPSIPGLWAYLASVLKVPTEPFGANPHALVL